jgi:transmembrane sensor
MDGKEDLEATAARYRELILKDPRAGDELRRGRAAFLEEVERQNAAASVRRPSARLRPWLALVFPAAVAAAAAAFWIWPRPVSFQIGEARPGELGSSVEATDGRTVPISFSEGSTLFLRQGGRIRVLSLEAGNTRVLVEDGVVDAVIAHRAGAKTRWDFEVGPYRVTVNGTKFRMAFRAGERSLRVSTEEGSVTVAGGCLPKPQTVSAGESLEPICPSGEVPPPHDMPAIEAAPAAPAAPARDVAPATRAMRVDRWRELLAAGRLLEGLRAAERANFDQVCRSATQKELMALGDAGRFFGPSRRAVAALVALRERFPGSVAAGTAAFTLGRIVFEKDHAYARAAGWFETYMREQPSGPLMGDAFGRLMEARLRSGDTTGARASAEQYLRRFPGGPYAGEARGIMSR